MYVSYDSSLIFFIKHRINPLFNLISQHAVPPSSKHFMEFLIKRSKKKPAHWEQLDAVAPDDVPLSEEEQEHLDSNEGYVMGEDVEGELGLQVNLP